MAKRLRLKASCGTPKMNTPYGLVTHEWRIVSDNAYVYKEMDAEFLDVDGNPIPEEEIAKVEPEPRPIEEAVESVEEVTEEKSVEEPKPEVEEEKPTPPPKKKRRKRKKK